ncbi:1 [Durusdinium trenchii]|uniref:1,3-beta-glucan synthase n=1 Tax=Durusdinium trenchii TaxID=1381693 RepID=A0ABP0R6B9_9DINO
MVPLMPVTPYNYGFPSLGSSEQSWRTQNFSDAGRRSEAVRMVCERLTRRLGFQKQSMQNQVEHIQALWESFMRRYNDPKQAMEVLCGQLLNTQRSWREKVWAQFLKPLRPVQQVNHPLRDVCLFWLIWGELGNLRFCPELLCFLFTAACELCDSSSEIALEEASEGSFLEEVVKPIYHVMVTETFDLRDGRPPVFKFGQAPATARACNYDDWNELFWDPWRLKRALRTKTGPVTSTARMTSSRYYRFIDTCHDSVDIWRKLTEVDWTESLRKHKTHLEFHSHLPLLIGNYRIFLLHTVAFCSLCCFWVGNLGRLQGLGVHLWRDHGWLIQASLGLLAPAWMLLYQIGFQALTPCLARRNRLRGLLQLICIDLLPVISFVALVWQHAQPEGVSQRFRYIPWLKVPTFDVLLVIHVFFSVFILILALGPRSDNLYRWKFYPTMSRPDCIPSGAFWLLTVALWSFFASSGTRYCSQAMLRIWDMYDSIGLPLPYLLGVLTTMVIVPTVLVFFSTLCFFLTFSISLVGSAVGAYRLGGVRLMCTRRGMGLTYLPETIVGRLLHLPPHPSRETGLWERFSWWRRMSDRELEAFVDVWNKLLQELRGRDLVCDRELEFLSFRSTQEAFQGHVPRLFQALSLRATLPANGEARRRIVSLARSVQMDPLPKAKVMDMPTLSVLIPHYSETIRYSKKDLFSDGVSNDLLRFLIKYYRDEFRNFIERLEANDLAFGSHGLEAALCEWASLRMQTLWRTVDGICGAYAHALEILSQYQAPEQHGTKAAVRQRLQVVVAMQQYAKFADPTGPGFSPQELQAVEAMFTSFGEFLSIAYIQEQVVDGEKRFYSCLIDASCEQIPIEGFEDVYARRAKYRVELPGFPILGHGKSDNQNCAMIFTRGEVLQMIDANQDAYFEASLFLPSALQEFCGPEKTLKGRPGIVGFREHIFSAVGLLGRLAADSEFTFGTMIQRTLDWPLNSRFHYGHPDLMDKLQVVQQGGVSKATRGLNLSEDIFAGLDLSLRGGWTVYKEYFHVGKGRDMGFMSVLSFYAKVSMGNAEQALTRQWMRLGLHLELSQLLGIFYSHIGFYMNQCLVNRATKAFCFAAVLFALAGEAQESFSHLAVEMISSYFGYFYLLFVLASMLPFVFETMLEEGGLAALWSLGSSLVALSPVFSAFQSKLMSHFFETTLHYGGAQYIPTGRGLATQREAFLKSFRCFAPSHMYDALEVVLFLAFTVPVDYGALDYSPGSWFFHGTFNTDV